MPIQPVTSSKTIQPKGTVKNPGGELGKNEFLKLLTAQLQYQDPMKAMDNTQYIAQLAQFAMVEQIENLNDSMNNLINIQNTQLGTSLIGKEVKVTKEGESYTGIVDKTSNLDGKLTISVNGQVYSIDEIEEIIKEEVINEETNNKETSNE